MTRTLLFADVHANLPALEAVLAEGRELGVDSYLFLGDAVGYGPHPSAVVDLMAGLPSSILLQGNHDYAVATGDTEGMSPVAAECIRWTQSRLSPDQRRWLSSLPLEHSEGPWMALHGAPIDPKKFNVYVYEMTCRDSLTAVQKEQKTTCFFGHTHVPGVHRRTDGTDETIHRPSRVRIVAGKHYLINPGSVGQPRDGNPKASFAVWDREGDEVTFHRVSYPREVTLAALKNAGLHEDLGYRLELGR
jgi:predicted phosphodiesterase